MKKILSALAVTSLLSSAAVFANDTAPHWNMVQTSYLTASIDGLDAVDPTGFAISGTILQTKKNVYL